MTQRGWFPASQMPTMDHEPIWSHPHPDSHLHLGNGSLMRAMDGVASMAVPGPKDHPSSSHSNYMPANSGPLHDPRLRPQLTASSYQSSADQVLCLQPPSSHQYGNSMVNPETEIGRAAYKRKSPAMPPFFSGCSADRYYSSGCSSNLQISLARPQYRPLDPAGITNSYGYENLMISGEDSQRNVRSRHNHTFHAETNPAMAYSSSKVPPHFHAAGHFSGPNMEGQSCHVPLPVTSQGSNWPSDPYINGSQAFAGPSSMNSTVGTNVAFHPNGMQSWHASSLPTFNEPLAHDTGATGSTGYNQRSNPNRSSSNYIPVGSATTSFEGDDGPSRLESVAAPTSSRYSRPLSITGRSSYRNGRIRSSYSRFQPSYQEDSARNRWSSEGAVTMDRTTYYDSRNWFDQHRDMRLDIDNMSYEELLDLEERIGYASTGLSEEKICSCLEGKTHRSSNQTDDPKEEKCAICLEEYKDQDELGKLGCRHDFHFGCIKSWLLIKNTCPICKAAAFSESPKEKQTLTA